MDKIKDHPLYRRHNIDSAMNALWEFYKERFIVLFLVSLVMSGLLQYGSTLIDLQDISGTKDPVLMLEKLRENILPISILAVVSLLFTTMLHYFILLQPIEGTSTALRSLLVSLRYFVPYLIIIVLLSFAGAIALILGLLALFIGVFFAAAYIAMISFFILPVMMVEDGNIDHTIRRTVRLAHKNFWPNMGWTAVFIILFLVTSLILSGLVLLPFAGSFMSAFANPEDKSQIITISTSPMFILLSSAVNALTLPLFPIFAFILYFNGRAQEDNVNINPVKEEGEYKVKVEDLYSKPRDDHSIS